MKTLALITSALLIAGVLSAQQLHEGNLIGTHIVKVNLAPGVTMDQFVQAWTTKAIPAYNENYPGWKMYAMKSRRGTVPENSLGLLFIIDSEQTRDKYYNPDGTLTDLAKAAEARLKPVLDEMDKLGTSETTYTDWVVTAKEDQLSRHNLEKGNLIGTHTIKVDLKPGVTDVQYIQALNEKMSPEITKIDPAWHMYPLKKIRGDAAENYSLLYIVDSEKERDKFYNADGSPTKEAENFGLKIQNSNDEINKLGTQNSVAWADWIIL
ncbi:MAG: hypothetical protein ACM3NR_02475 [Methanosarcina sp.]